MRPFGKAGTARAAIALLAAAAFSAPAVAEAPASLTLIRGCALYSDPAAPPIANGAVLISGKTIEAVGPEDRITAPPGTRVIDCSGGAMTAAFWNNHVHFMESKWAPAGTLPASVLSSQLRDMLGRYGFAYAVDTGSDLANTVALRKRIETGEVDGPVIFTAGSVFVPPDGQPAYLDFKLPEIATPEQARAMIAANFDGGADAVKLMTVPATACSPHPAMHIDVVRAAVDEAHRRGKPAFAHPTDMTGLRLAIDGGIDVVLHTAFEGGPWSPELVADMVKHDVALTPTIKLWKYEASKTGGTWWVEGRALSIGQLKAFSEGGGTVLFGTDVGYMTDYDPTDEYVAMAEAGMSVGRILASLTTAPASRFGRADRTGRLAPGMDADLVILDGDPAADVTSFARVRRLYRAGRLIHEEE